MDTNQILESYLESQKEIQASIEQLKEQHQVIRKKLQKRTTARITSSATLIMFGLYLINLDIIQAIATGITVMVLGHLVLFIVAFRYWYSITDEPVHICEHFEERTDKECPQCLAYPNCNIKTKETSQ